MIDKIQAFCPFLRDSASLHQERTPADAEKLEVGFIFIRDGAMAQVIMDIDDQSAMIAV